MLQNNMYNKLIDEVLSLSFAKNNNKLGVF